MSQFNLYAAPPFFFSKIRDPDFASVVLLIHGDADANDHSNSGHTVTLNGDAALSSSQSKFGTNSIFCDGTGDYISVSDASDFDFGTGDYTIEAWVYRSGAQGANARLWCASDANDVSMYLAGGTTPNCFHDSTNVASSTVLTDGAWVHIAQVRESGTVALFQGGSREATGSDSATVNLSGLYFGNGAGAAAGQYFDGYYNEIRVTAGVARYSGSSYTVPTAPFPDA